MFPFPCWILLRVSTNSWSFLATQTNGVSENKIYIPVYFLPACPWSYKWSMLDLSIAPKWTSVSLVGGSLSFLSLSFFRGYVIWIYKVMPLNIQGHFVLVFWSYILTDLRALCLVWCMRWINTWCFCCNPQHFTPLYVLSSKAHCPHVYRR